MLAALCFVVVHGRVEMPSEFFVDETEDMSNVPVVAAHGSYKEQLRRERAAERHELETQFRSACDFGQSTILVDARKDQWNVNGMRALDVLPGTKGYDCLGSFVRDPSEGQIGGKPVWRMQSSRAAPSAAPGSKPLHWFIFYNVYESKWYVGARPGSPPYCLSARGETPIPVGLSGNWMVENYDRCDSISNTEKDQESQCRSLIRMFGGRFYARPSDVVSRCTVPTPAPPTPRPASPTPAPSTRAPTLAPSPVPTPGPQTGSVKPRGYYKSLQELTEKRNKAAIAKARQEKQFMAEEIARVGKETFLRGLEQERSAIKVKEESYAQLHAKSMREPKDTTPEFDIMTYGGLYGNADTCIEAIKKYCIDGKHIADVDSCRACAQSDEQNFKGATACRAFRSVSDDISLACRKMIDAQQLHTQLRKEGVRALTSSVFEPDGGFRSANAEVAACFLDKAVRLGEIFHDLATCQAFFGRKDEPCYNNALQRLSHMVRYCCIGSQHVIMRGTEVRCKRASVAIVSKLQSDFGHFFTKCSTSLNDIDCHNFRKAYKVCALSKSVLQEEPEVKRLQGKEEQEATFCKEAAQPVLGAFSTILEKAHALYRDAPTDDRTEMSNVLMHFCLQSTSFKHDCVTRFFLAALGTQLAGTPNNASSRRSRRSKAAASKPGSSPDWRRIVLKGQPSWYNDKTGDTAPITDDDDATTQSQSSINANANAKGDDDYA